jgi:hypothetical protein
MSGEAKVAWAEYETHHNGSEHPCVGTLLMTGDDAFLLRERIQIGMDQDLGREIFDERSRVLSLPEAKRVLNDWIALEIAEVVQVPWD